MGQHVTEQRNKNNQPRQIFAPLNSFSKGDTLLNIEMNTL